MKTDNSKLVLGLIIGAALGAAVGAFLASDKKEEILEGVKDAVDKAKKKIGEVVHQGIDELDVAVDKVNTIAQSAISRVKSARKHPEEI